MNNTIRTFTGKYVDITDLKVEDIDIRDIAHALSNMCRFHGHCSRFYSVAEHSVLVSLFFDDPQDRKEAALHDAAETYLPDLANPIKNLPQFSFYKELEDSIYIPIAKKFNLPEKIRPEIKQADKALLELEIDILMKGIKYETDIKGLKPKEAESIFLKTFNEVCNETNKVLIA